MKGITLQSPAKLNLSLKIISKMPDGFHELKTLFERINLCDDIQLSPNKIQKIRVFCNHPQVPKGPKNLVYKVAQLLQNTYNINEGIDITINKRIPVAAGLGGGSSNAATVLRGLNKIWKLKLSFKELLSFGCLLGSDVPFFLHNCSWGLGVNRGDQVRAIAIRPKFWHVLVVPCVKMYSREVFTSFKLQLTKTTDNVNILIHSLKVNNIIKVQKLLENDLSGSILEVGPQLKYVRKRLSALQEQGTVFSGSGPSVFSLTQSKKEAENFKNILSKYYKRVYAVRTL